MLWKEKKSRLFCPGKTGKTIGKPKFAEDPDDDNDGIPDAEDDDNEVPEDDDDDHDEM